MFVDAVRGLYSKTGGKNGKHAGVNDVHNIAAISYLVVQLFELSYGVFRAVTSRTAILQTFEYSHLPSSHCLCKIHKVVAVGNSQVDVNQEVLALFCELQNGFEAFGEAIKFMNQRGTAKPKASVTKSHS